MSHGTADTSDAASAPDHLDADQSVSARGGSKGDASERLWAYDGFTSAVESPLADDPATDPTAGPTRRRSIRAALRRRTWLWCTTAVIGLIAGLALFVDHPPGYQASASVLLTYSPGENAAEASVTDLALAQSRSVAEGTLRRLGLREGLADFLASYTITAVTERVLLITITAPSSDQAVVRANALAAEFLQFRAALLENQQQLVFAALDRQFAQAPSPATLALLQAAITTYEANAQVATTSTVNESKVLSMAAPIRRSLRKTLTDPGGGFLGGLGLGMGLVVVETLVSDRIRWRDDVAHALGAPVKFSVGKVRLSRWLPGRHGLAATRRAQIQRIAAYLGGVVPPTAGNVAALAVVPVRDSRVAALSLVSLARNCAERGQRVILADLCRGAPAARVLRAKAPGLHEVHVRGVPLTLAVPDRDDLVPIGPLDRDPRRSRVDQPAGPLVAACASADLILTLADLDPALGAEHLPGWASDAVVVVTAGRSSSAKIHMIGEMIRLAGLSLVSGVLVGADKTDESIGSIPGRDVAADAMSLPQEAPHLLPGAR
jgi:capsular polysaccharide biosynthesis protein